MLYEPEQLDREMMHPPIPFQYAENKSISFSIIKNKENPNTHPGFQTCLLHL
jgi:hypothetical protein